MARAKTSKEYEDLGRVVAAIYESGHLNRAQTFKFSFLKGALSGLGGVIGATVGIALLLAILNLFETVPLIGRFVESLQDTINR